MSMMHAVTLTKSYMSGSQETHALRGINFTVQAGEFVSIMGPSGSGKSTLLQILGGLDRPTSGSVLFDGKDLSRMSELELSLFRRRRLGFIFQFFHLLPTMSAIENVALPLLLDNIPFRKVKDEAQALLASVGMRHRMNHFPNQLSGGEMQRVAIARALITRPALILADEPTGNLDSRTSVSILDYLAGIARERNQTILMVTHDPEAAKYGSRLIRLNDGMVESDVRLPGVAQEQLSSEPATKRRGSTEERETAHAFTL